MRLRRCKLAIFAFCWLVSGMVGLTAMAMLPQHAVGQSNFHNLNFEMASIPNPNGTVAGVDAASAFPFWTVTIGGVVQTQVTYDGITLGEANVAILDSKGHLLTGNFTAIEGNYTAFLQFGLNPIQPYYLPVEAAISQTAIVPVSANSLTFLSYSDGTAWGRFTGTMDGVPLTITSVTSVNGHYQYTCDVSAYAGNLHTLTFTSSLLYPYSEGAGFFSLDGIAFHTIKTPAPQPNVFAWGINIDGELGDGTLDASFTPVQVGPTGITSVAAGIWHTAALRADGTVWTWGENIGLEPEQIADLMGVSAISAGYDDTLALKADGTVWAWGLNDNGQLGDSTNWKRLLPVQAIGLQDIKAIAAGSNHSVAAASPTGLVSGSVALQGCASPQGQTLTFTFRPTDGAAPFTQTTTLAANGAFLLTDVPARPYKVAIKGTKWLQKVVSVDATSGNAFGVSILLPAGDANNDNIVDIGDFSILVNAFDTVTGDANFDASVDFNCDGGVDISDFGLLTNNYRLRGDP